MDDLCDADLVEAWELLEGAAGVRRRLRGACELAVRRWRWAAEESNLHRPEPLYNERYGLPRAKLLADVPRSPDSEQLYGLDAFGEIVVAREHVGPRAFREELRVHRGDSVVGYRWSRKGTPTQVNIARYVDGRPRSYVAAYPESGGLPRGSVIEHYVFDGDRVNAIFTETVIGLGDRSTLPILATIWPSFDPSGRVLEIREHSVRGERVLYRARRRATPMAKLHQRVEDRLVEVLPALVGEHAREPIYCLALHYQLEWPLPPTAVLGSERERRERMADIRGGEALWPAVYNPAAFGSYTGHSLGGRPLTDLDAELAATLDKIPVSTQESRQRGRATLNRVARRLQNLDWRPIAPVTDDFVVFAVDLELTHLQDNLHHSIPAPLHKLLLSCESGLVDVAELL
jgi:hypothetical protein